MPYQRLEVPSDGDWELVRRNFQALRMDMNPPVPQARVVNNANIALTNNTLTALTFNSERWDSGDLHSTSADTGRLTAPITGLYLIGAQVSFASNATGIREIDIRLNGTTFIAADTKTPLTGSATVMNVVTQYQLVAGDYVEVTAFQTSGGNLNVVASSNYSPEFWMHRVAGYVNQGV